MTVLLRWPEVTSRLQGLNMPVHAHAGGALHPVVNLERRRELLVAVTGGPADAPLTTDALDTLWRLSPALRPGRCSDDAVAQIGTGLVPISVILLLHLRAGANTDTVALVCATRTRISERAKKDREPRLIPKPAVV